MMGSPPDKNETKIMASKKTSKRMKRLLGNIAHVEGVDNTLPVTERLKMFLDGRINVKDQVICTNGVLQRKYLPYNTQCSRQ